MIASQPSGPWPLGTLSSRVFCAHLWPEAQLCLLSGAAQGALAQDCSSNVGLGGRSCRIYLALRSDVGSMGSPTETTL